MPKKVLKRNGSKAARRRLKRMGPAGLAVIRTAKSHRRCTLPMTVMLIARAIERASNCAEHFIHYVFTGLHWRRTGNKTTCYRTASGLRREAQSSERIRLQAHLSVPLSHYLHEGPQATGQRSLWALELMCSPRKGLPTLTVSPRPCRIISPKQVGVSARGS